MQESAAQPETDTALRCLDAVRRESRELPELPASTRRAREALKQGEVA